MNMVFEINGTNTTMTTSFPLDVCIFDSVKMFIASCKNNQAVYQEFANEGCTGSSVNNGSVSDLNSVGQTFVQICEFDTNCLYREIQDYELGNTTCADVMVGNATYMSLV